MDKLWCDLTVAFAQADVTNLPAIIAPREVQHIAVFIPCACFGFVHKQVPCCTLVDVATVVGQGANHRLT